MKRICISIPPVILSLWNSESYNYGSYKIGKAPLTPCPARFQLKSDGQEKSENNLNFVAGVKKKNEFIHR